MLAQDLAISHIVGKLPEDVHAAVTMKCHKYWPPLEDDCPSWTWIGVIEFLNGFGVTITTGPTFTNPNGCWEVFGLLPNGEYDGTLVGALDSDGPAQYLTFEVMAQRISTVARAAA